MDIYEKLLSENRDKMIKAVIFDLDGTLACTLPDLTEGVSRTRARFGRPPITEAEVLKFINGTTHEYIHNCFPDLTGEQMHIAEQTYMEEYSHCFLDHTYAYEGLTEVVDELKRRGFRLAVFTNKDNLHANAIVKKLYGEDTFEMIIGTGMFPGKPDPTGAVYIAEKLGAAPEETAFIGDSDVDVHTGINAGMVRLDVSWGYRSEDILIAEGAQYMAHTPADIIKIIDEINSEK